MQKTSLHICWPTHTLSRVFYTCSHTSPTVLMAGGTRTFPKQKAAMELQYYSRLCLQQERETLCLLLNRSSVKLSLCCWLNPLWLPRHSRKVMPTADLGPADPDRRGEGTRSTLSLFRIKKRGYLLIMKEMEKCSEKHITYAHLYNPCGMEHSQTTERESN